MISTIVPGVFKFHVKLLIPILLLMSCVQSPDNEKPAEKQTINVRYETSAHKMDVTYCREDGAITAEYGVYKFEKTLEIEIGQTACLSVTKIITRNNIAARVYIYVNDSLVIKNSGMDGASASVEL